MTITVVDLLQYSFENNLSHIPSALSMTDYLSVLFREKIVTPDDFIVIGKPFGAQAYYLVWRDLGLLSNIETLSVGVKHAEIPFVDYSEETIGNALGVAIGIAMTTSKRVWVNLSDAALQMGNVLEAIQFIGQHNLSNIFVTIDYNQTQVTGKVDDIITVAPVKHLFNLYNWHVMTAHGHNHTQLRGVFANLNPDKPNVVFCNTIKGAGVPAMSDNPAHWHYRKLSSQDEIWKLLG